jgi:hypothetical protein
VTGPTQQRIPLGASRSPHAVRRWRLRRVDVSALGPVTLGGLGALAALAGIALALMEPQAEVRMDGSSYTIAGQTFASNGGHLYQAASGATLLVERRDGRLVAAASTNLDGQHMVGRCEARAGGRSESCSFRIGTRSVTAVDTRTGDGWSRRYSDGRTAAIKFVGAADTPVPFPVGL